MEAQRRRIKRKVRNRRTFKNVLKKRLSSEYWKANVVIVVIFLILVTVGGYFVWTMPMPDNLYEENGVVDKDRKNSNNK